MKWLMMSDKNWCLNCPTECHFSPWRAEHCTKVTILCCLKPAKIQKTSQHPHPHANAICQGQTPHLLQHSRTAWLDGENKTIFLGNPFPLKKKKKKLFLKRAFSKFPPFFFFNIWAETNETPTSCKSRQHKYWFTIYKSFGFLICLQSQLLTSLAEIS